MSDATQPQGPNQLRANTLGAAAIAFLVVSAAAPLTAVAGGVPLAMLLGNGAGVAGGVAIVTLILLVFSVGYVAMARHVRNAGAFYAFASQGFGGHAGGAAAMVATLAYNCMQIGILGLLGFASATTFGAFGLNLPWWAWSYMAIALVAVLGYRQVDLSAKILIGLVILEYLIVIVVNAAVWRAGGDSGLSMAPFSPEHVFSGIPSNALLFCFAFFIGFEATTIFSEEARNPAKSIPRATYGSVLAIGVFYMITAWLMANAVGVDNLLPTLQGMADPTLLLFDIAGRYLGEPVPTVMGLLFVTSLFAAVLAFHNAVARYIYVGGREGLLPASVGVTHPKHQSPHVGSLIQTVLAVAVVTLFAVLGLDPVLALFTWLTQLGALGVIGLMAVTSFAVVRFFSTRGALGERVHATKILPILSGLVLSVIFVMAYAKFGTMTGASGLLGIALPSLVPVAALVGYLLAVSLSHRDNEQFTSLGSAR